MKHLKWDDLTTKILTNLSNINKQIMFHPGSVVGTMAVSKKVMCRANTSIKSDRSFAIDDLRNLLNAIGLFRQQDTRVILQDKFLTIDGGDDSRQITFTYTEPENIVVTFPHDKEIKLTPTVSFSIKADVIKDILKASGALGVSDVVFEGSDGKVSIKVMNIEYPNSHKYILVVGETDVDFRIVTKVDSLNKLYPCDYDVALDCQKSFLHFHNEQIEYWLAGEV